MLSKSKFLKTAVAAALIGLAGVASIAPASARDHDRHGSRDSGWGRDRGDHRGWGRHDRHDRDDRGWRHRHHRHHGWY
ncbi:MAG TPA: hypothetical protein VGC36_17685 [Rhizomicrobium sp.]